MIEWRPELSVNVREIDGQHRTFISIVNELLACIEDGCNREVVGLIIRKLDSYAQYHFATEEKYFTLFKFELAAEHVGLHQDMLKRLRGFRERHFEKGQEVIGEFFAFVADWLTDHFMVQDKKYVKCFNEHGLF